MKWAWARPSRPSPPAPCCTGSARRSRVLVVTPASLKTEWEEQIQRFTDLPYQLVFGTRPQRLKAYEAAGGRKAGETPAPLPFFTIVNYEQMLADALEVNQRLRPDVVVLDEAQRIKNWSTKTTPGHQAAAQPLRLHPHRHAHREPHRRAVFADGLPRTRRCSARCSASTASIYDLDDRGRPAGYRNLDKLHERITPHMLRRRKSRRGNRTARAHRPQPLRPAQRRAAGRIRRPRGRRRPAGHHRQAPPAHPAGAGQAAAPSGHDAHGLRHQLHPRPRTTAPARSWPNWRRSSRNAATTPT